MLKRVLHNLILISLIQILHSGCDYEPSSFGDFEKIYVFADSTLYDQVKPELGLTFDQFVYTPHSERSFYLDLQPLSMLETYQTRRNLLFIGLLNGRDEVSKFVTQALSENVQSTIRSGKVFEIFKSDLFATDQEVMFFTATDIANLKKNLSDRKDIIFNRLNTSYFQRLEKAMFLQGEQLEVEDYLAGQYGWKIRVQYDYEIVKETDDNRFIWFRRLNPDRCLFIYRFPYKNFDDEGRWIFQIRDSLTKVYFEGDSIDREDTYIQYINFHGMDAKKLIGVWQNRKYYIGGPFRTYAFADQDKKYMYLIDISVTAPGRRKKPYLDQLEVLANSFQFVNDKKPPR